MDGPSHPLLPLSLGVKAAYLGASASKIRDDVTTGWQEARDGGNDAVGRLGGGVPGGEVRVAGHAVRHCGTIGCRNAVQASVARGRTVHSSQDVGRDNLENLVDLLLGAGPRRHSRWGQPDVGGSVGSADGVVAYPVRWHDSGGWPAGVASDGRRHGRRRSSSGPGAWRAGTSVHSP